MMARTSVRKVYESSQSQELQFAKHEPAEIHHDLSFVMQLMAYCYLDATSQSQKDAKLQKMLGSS